MTTNFQQVRSIFMAALERPADEWNGYLAEACGRDAGLREQVQLLLDAHRSKGGMLDGASWADEVTRALPAQERSDMILAGKYKLIERIGEGGMGSVWLAQQSEPVKRKVAVKLIKLGMDSRQVLTRFEAERQALAMMDHPNIAKVLDGGLTSDGRPFFVMELVKGTPITEYCDACKLSLQERLELFLPVCQAIQHAHQKGIIHRDIKPSNVMIALYDDKPVPKVIDFGVAKATGQSLSAATLNTGFGGVVGTPQYMSPEQATLNNLDIDTRSDVYSLGVLLYELLTGSPPFTKAELEHKGLMEMLRVVREDEPPKPSTKLSSAGTLPTLSANRSIEPRKLRQTLQSELDWIVMKALEKNRVRRYETANSLAADVQRYLTGEPVAAHPPSASYLMRKFLRRHRPQVVAASLVLLVLLAGIAGTTFGLIRAKPVGCRRTSGQGGRTSQACRSRSAATPRGN
jgi:serine/threonine protein kinase